MYHQIKFDWKRLKSYSMNNNLLIISPLTVTLTLTLTLKIANKFLCLPLQWGCTTLPNLVTEGWEVQKTLSEQNTDTQTERTTDSNSAPLNMLWWVQGSRQTKYEKKNAFLIGQNKSANSSTLMSLQRQWTNGYPTRTMTKQFVNEKEGKQFSCCLESSSPCRKNYRQHLSFYHSYVTLNCHLWKNSMQQPNWFCSLSLYHNYLSIVRMHERIYCQKCAGNLGYPIKKIFLSGLLVFFSEDTLFDIFLIMKGFCQQNITLIIWYSQLNRRQQEAKKTNRWLGCFYFHISRHFRSWWQHLCMTAPSPW